MSAPATAAAAASMIATVTAPSDMEAGYSFQAMVDGRAVDVIAPEGGLKEGQTVEFPVGSAPPETFLTVDGESMVAPTTATEHQLPLQGGGTSRMDSAPRGQWRQGLCDCLGGNSCGCGLCCCACWCTPLVQAQLLTRMRLNFLGEPAASDAQAQNTFWIVLVVFLVSLCGNGILPAIAGIVFFVYSIVYATRLRGAMRRRYAIPGSCCNKNGTDECCDDCCCACCCPCCTAIQMARHTHPDMYDCGAPDGIPKVV